MTHNRDVDGCKMLIFSVQLHTRGSGNMEDLRKLMIYWIERLERYFMSRLDKVTGIFFFQA